MNRSITSPMSIRMDHISWSAKWARNVLFNCLNQLSDGYIVIKDGAERWTFGNPGSPVSLHADMIIFDHMTYVDVVCGGCLGAGEAYMDAAWDSTDLAALVRVMVRNQDVLQGLDTHWSWARAPMRYLGHLFNRNSKTGSRRNIQAHYDLGNDLFAQFLDPTMMYSSGIFERADMTMEEASVAKLDRLCKKLDLHPSDHLLEIGTGWGGMALHAAKHYGCRVTTTTLSQEQHDWTKRKIQEEGLEHRITLLLNDYRDLEGQYDKLVSIEMIEAVGHQYYGEYFKTCAALLKPDGLMAIQAITIDERRYEAAKHHVDFIKRYIFPGSCIPSQTALLTAMTRSSDLTPVHLEDITPHYAETLRHWRRRFMENAKTLLRLKYDQRFIRMWEYYFCYCEGGFDERGIGVVQLSFRKPHHRVPIVLGRL